MQDTRNIPTSQRGRDNFKSGRAQYQHFVAEIADRVRNEQPRRVNQAAIRMELRGRGGPVDGLACTKENLVREYVTQSPALHSPGTAVTDILRYTDHFGAILVDRERDVWPRFSDGGALAFVGDMATKALEADVLALLTDLPR